MLLYYIILTIRIVSIFLYYIYMLHYMYLLVNGLRLAE